MYLVWHALEEDGCGGDLLFGSEETVGEVAAVGQVKPHDAAVRLHQGGVDREVARRATVCPTGLGSEMQLFD